MRALVRDQAHDPPVAIHEAEAPEPAPGEALVEVRASSLNRGELVLLANRPDGWRPGQDLAGIVVRPAADGSGPREGERVVGLLEGEAWAELAAARCSALRHGHHSPPDRHERREHRLLRGPRPQGLRHS